MWHIFIFVSMEHALSICYSSYHLFLLSWWYIIISTLCRNWKIVYLYTKPQILCYIYACFFIALGNYTRICIWFFTKQHRKDIPEANLWWFCIRETQHKTKSIVTDKNIHIIILVSFQNNNTWWGKNGKYVAEKSANNLVVIRTNKCCEHNILWSSLLLTFISNESWWDNYKLYNLVVINAINFSPIYDRCMQASLHQCEVHTKTFHIVQLQANNAHFHQMCGCTLCIYAHAYRCKEEMVGFHIMLWPHFS